MKTGDYGPTSQREISSEAVKPKHPYSDPTRPVAGRDREPASHRGTFNPAGTEAPPARGNASSEVETELTETTVSFLALD